MTDTISRPNKDNNNKTNNNFCYLQVAKSHSRQGSKPLYPQREVKYMEHSQNQMSKISTGKTVYVGNV